MRTHYGFMAATIYLAMWPLAGLAAAATSNQPVDAVTIYNQGAAVVQDTRTVKLKKGSQSIGWPIAGNLRADTFWLRGPGVQVAGFTAAGHGRNADDPLASRIGKPVTLTREGLAGKAHDRRRATLIGVHEDNVYVRIKHRVERLTPASPWRVGWPAAKGGQRAGALRLSLDAARAGNARLTARYQVDGPTWAMNYNGRFDAGQQKLKLTGAALVDNQGGRRLKAERAWLVAGDVARVGKHQPRPVAMMRQRTSRAAGSAEPAGQRYRYPLRDGLDIAAGGSRAFSVLPNLLLSARRDFVLRYRLRASARSDAPRHAAIRLHIENDTGQPLPAGAVRVYDSAHQATLSGADRIGNTPAGASATLDLGRAFDITGTRRVLEDSRGKDGQHQRKVAITLHNAGKHEASVRVVTQLPQAARVVSASSEAVADHDATRAQWKLEVSAGGQRKLAYTARWSEQ